jgi:hypothetical protein
MSEAYFWKNDFFPFNRADLKHSDPGTAELIGRLWKQPSPDSAFVDPAAGGKEQEKITCDIPNDDVWRQ